MIFFFLNRGVVIWELWHAILPSSWNQSLMWDGRNERLRARSRMGQGPYRVLCHPKFHHTEWPGELSLTWVENPTVDAIRKHQEVVVEMEVLMLSSCLFPLWCKISSSFSKMVCFYSIVITLVTLVSLFLDL